jgi:hypothetical protein
MASSKIRIEYLCSHTCSLQRDSLTNAQKDTTPTQAYKAMAYRYNKYMAFNKLGKEIHGTLIR